MPVKFLISPALRLLVEALGVALHADLDRRVDEDLDELAVADQLARHAPLGAERRDERDEHDQPGIDEQLRRLADAADVLDAVGIGEAEVAVEPVADIVAVEHDRCGGRRRTARFSTRLAMVDLPEPDRPVNHSTAGFWPFSSARALLVHVERLPMHVGGAAQAEIDHAGADGARW